MIISMEMRTTEGGVDILTKPQIRIAPTTPGIIMWKFYFSMLKVKIFDASSTVVLNRTTYKDDLYQC